MRITAKFNSCWFLFFPGNIPSPLGTSKNDTFFIFRETKILTTLKSESIRELASCFGNTEMDNERIGAAGIEIMLKRLS